ncbi:hypothetical protein Tco_0056973 [Tanacetum coccineum]
MAASDWSAAMTWHATWQVNNRSTLVNHRRTTSQRWSTTVNHHQTTSQWWSTKAVNGGRAPLTTTVDHRRTTARPPPEQCSGRVAGGHVAADVAADVDNQEWKGLERLTSRLWI